MAEIPVTILSGSLGAGKTTLLTHLLRTADDRDVAVLVNDMGEVNVDAELVAEGSQLAIDDGVAELSNGCICCELQDDLETAVVRLARTREFDHLVVEPSGISEPEPIARLFTAESRVAARYAVDAVVTVLDTPLFLDAFAGVGVPERRDAGDGERPLSDLLVDQVEFADVVLLNKADRCSADGLDEAEALVGALRPTAGTYRTEFCEVGPDRVLGVGPFDAGPDGDRPGWKRALAAADDGGGGHAGHDHGHAGHSHPDEMYGVGSFTYRRRRPFHPERFAAVLRDLPDGIVRSKGTAWVAGNDQRVLVSGAGPSVRATAQGPWIAGLPEVERDLYRSNRPELDWHDDHGDRRTELVWIGTDYDEGRLRERLNDALVTDDEWDAAESTDGDPFPHEQGREVAVRDARP